MTIIINILLMLLLIAGTFVLLFNTGLHLHIIEQSNPYEYEPYPTIHFVVHLCFVSLIKFLSFFINIRASLIEVSPHTRDFSHELGDTI